MQIIAVNQTREPFPQRTCCTVHSHLPPQETPERTFNVVVLKRRTETCTLLPNDTALSLAHEVTAHKVTAHTTRREAYRRMVCRRGEPPRQTLTEARRRWSVAHANLIDASA